MIQKQICQHCGAEFVPVRNDSRIKYCSAECKERSRWRHTRTELDNASLERHEKILQLYNTEYSAAEVAEMSNCSVGFVYATWRKAGFSKRMTRQQRAVMELRKQGKCSVEIAEELNIDVGTVGATAKVIGAPFTEEEKQRSIKIGRKRAFMSQHGDITKYQIAFVAEHYPNFEYVSGNINSDGFVELLCKECSETFKRSAVSVRHTDTNIICPICEEKRKQERNAEKEAKRQERERQKAKAFWNQKFQQISFKIHQCEECGTYIIGGRGRYCSESCRRKHINRKHDKRLERAEHIDKTITLKKLYKRDQGVCWICGKKCDYNDYVKDDKGNFIVGANYPSIDHVYPLSRGGNHEWANVKLAHCYCNTLKSNKVVAYG